MRHQGLADLDQALCDFYTRHLENVSSLPALNRLLRGHPEPGFLCATEADLMGSPEVDFDAQAFPDAMPLGGREVPLSYAYSPGEEHDGVTVKLDIALAQTVSPATVE